MIRVLANIGSLVTCREMEGQGNLGIIENAALVWENASILWAGTAEALPKPYRALPGMDAGGRLVIPGLIDCHTHLAFGGWRTDEFELRALGRGYLEIAKAGGGINATVAATRRASEEALVSRCRRVLDEMLELGITTVECKSGYGLSLEAELKQLRVYQRLDAIHPMKLVPTLLAAHIVPPEYASRRRQYIDLIRHEIIPAAVERGLARFCDVFVEETAFRPDEAAEILETARASGLRAKLHVDQLSNGGGAALAAQMDAISAEHLEYATADGIAKMAEKDVVAVSLPMATFNLRQPAMPARAFIDAGVPVAVSTDFNPGSAPSYHLPAAMYMASILQYMSPAEVLKGATLYAAKALGLEHRVGRLQPGFSADFAVIDASDVNAWIGHFRANANLMTVKEGTVVYSKNNSAEAPHSRS